MRRRHNCFWHELSYTAPKGDCVIRRNKAIITALREAKTELGPTDIASITTLSNDVVRQLMPKLVKDGDVTKSARGKYRAA